MVKRTARAKFSLEVPAHHIDTRGNQLGAKMKLSTGTALALLAACVTALPGGDSHGSSKKPKGIVYTDGWKFKLDGKPFLYAGSNAYWLPFLENPEDLEVTFKAAKKAGLKVIRTWGFNDKNETFIPGGLPQYGGEGAGAAPVYFQSWSKGKPKINYGKNGLQAFDNVVKQAEKYDIKLLVALTNNWADYGGMVSRLLAPFLVPSKRSQVSS